MMRGARPDVEPHSGTSTNDPSGMAAKVRDIGLTLLDEPIRNARKVIR